MLKRRVDISRLWNNNLLIQYRGKLKEMMQIYLFVMRYM